MVPLGVQSITAVHAWGLILMSGFFKMSLAMNSRGEKSEFEKEHELLAGFAKQFGIFVGVTVIFFVGWILTGFMV